MSKWNIRLLAAVMAAGMIAAVGCDNKTGDDVSQAASSEASSAVESEPPKEEPDVGEHKDYDKQDAKADFFGGLIIAEQDGAKRCMEVFRANEDSGSFYASELNAMKDRLGPKVEVYSMAVPTACELYCPANMRAEIDSQADIIANINDSFVTVKSVDVLTTLTNHNAENIYYRTDTRWSPLGAYYAGKAFAKAAGVEYADISEYIPSKAVDYVGNMSMFLDYETLETLKTDPDEFVYYKPKAKYKTYYYDEEFEFLTDGEFFEEVEDSMYDTFFKGGFYSLKIETGVKNGRRLIIIKDNAGTAIVPFFTSSFEEIYVVDKDYTQANVVEMIEDFKITDVLYCVDMFTITTQEAYSLETIRTQATHGRLEDNATDSDDTDSSKKKNTDSDSDEETSGPKYIYDVGLNNSVGEVEESDNYENIPNDQYEYPDDGEENYYGEY